MYEAMATVTGTVVTHPVRRELANGEPVITFRVASHSRRLDFATQQWVDNGTLFLTVSCWRRLVPGVLASIRRGDPVMVHGQLRSHEYRAKDGVERRDLEMRAMAIGPDLARCTAEITRRADRSRASGEAAAEGGESAAERDENGAEGGIEAGADGSFPAAGEEALPEARVASRNIAAGCGAAPGAAGAEERASGTVSRPDPSRIAEPADA